MKYTPIQIKPSPFDYKTKFGKIIPVTRIEISGDEYHKCDEQSMNMWGSKKKGKYGAGLLNSREDPFRTERLGLLGEMAVCKCINQPINLSYAEYGDGGSDIIIKDIRFDVKTASYDYGMVCIQVINEGGKHINKDVGGYIATFKELDDYDDKRAVIILVGYQFKGFVDSLPTVPARKGSHFNKELLFDDLIPFYSK